MKAGLAAALLAPLALMACAPAPSGERLSATICRGGSPAGLVGRNIGQFTIPRAVPNLIISPGVEVPTDRQPGRLRIFVDDKGWIARAECE